SRRSPGAPVPRGLVAAAGTRRVAELALGRPLRPRLPGRALAVAVVVVEAAGGQVGVAAEAVGGAGEVGGEAADEAGDHCAPPSCRRFDRASASVAVIPFTVTCGAAS